MPKLNRFDSATAKHLRCSADIARMILRASTQPVIVVHGGCGSPASGRLRDEEGYHRELAAAVDAARRRPGRRRRALDAAQAAVQLLEDAPQFNAGRGSVLTLDGGGRDGRRT